MLKILWHDNFRNWLRGLPDRMTRLRLTKRLRKAELGLLGDVKPVGDGIFEMREDFGSGWHMYYIKRGDAMILMLGGGDKSTQAKDIKAAKDLAETLED